MPFQRDPRHILFGLPASRYSWRGLWLLAGLYFGSLLVAAAISPPIYHFAQTLQSQWGAYLASKPYPDFYDRLRLLSVVALFPPLFMACGLKTRERIGFRGKAGKTAGAWFLGGLGMMALVYGLSGALGALAPKSGLDAPALAEKAAIALAGACLVGLVEETLFRGLVFRIFYTALRPLPAIFLSSLFFALLHFKADDALFADVPPSAIGWIHGLQAARETLFAPVADFQVLLCLNLVLAGILLHLAFLLSGSLWACIGLHAGWVFPILALSKSFDAGPGANAFTGSERLVDGWWVSIAMLAVGGVLAARLARRDRTQADAPERPA